MGTIGRCAGGSTTSSEARRSERNVAIGAERLLLAPHSRVIVLGVAEHLPRGCRAERTSGSRPFRCARTALISSNSNHQGLVGTLFQRARLSSHTECEGFSSCPF